MRELLFALLFLQLGGLIFFWGLCLSSSLREKSWRQRGAAAADLRPLPPGHQTNSTDPKTRRAGAVETARRYHAAILH